MVLINSVHEFPLEALIVEPTVDVSMVPLLHVDLLDYGLLDPLDLIVFTSVGVVIDQGNLGRTCLTIDLQLLTVVFIGAGVEPLTHEWEFIQLS